MVALTPPPKRMVFSKTDGHDCGEMDAETNSLLSARAARLVNDEHSFNDIQIRIGTDWHDVHMVDDCIADERA